MSDNEGATKKSGYRLEYASSARAKCKGVLSLKLDPLSPYSRRMFIFCPHEGAKPCTGEHVSNAN